jgi:hypothetical protein
MGRDNASGGGSGSGGGGNATSADYSQFDYSGIDFSSGNPDYVLTPQEGYYDGSTYHTGNGTQYWDSPVVPREPGDYAEDATGYYGSGHAGSSSQAPYDPGFYGDSGQPAGSSTQIPQDTAASHPDEGYGGHAGSSHSGSKGKAKSKDKGKAKDKGKHRR